MPSALDRQYDAVLEKITGEGGPFQIGQDDQGRAIVTNLPATVPVLFDFFCALHGDKEALVTGDERLNFTDLNAQATRLARALAGSGIAKGDRGELAVQAMQPPHGRRVGWADSRTLLLLARSPHDALPAILGSTSAPTGSRSGRR